MRKSILTICTAIIILIQPAFAAANAVSCKNAYTILDLNTCAARELSKAQIQLDRVYAQSAAVAQKTDQANPKGGNAKKSLEAAQLSWEKYMQANCAYVKALYEGGSEQTLQYLSCKAQMTSERAKLLNDLFVNR